ncbi:MAG: M55 family metallopeptidase [Gemmatimonadales bacterium]
MIRPFVAAARRFRTASAPALLLTTVAGCAQGPGTRYTLESPAANADGTIRVLIIHDMEGLSGQDDWRSALSYHEDEYRRGQELLAADVNAVVAGLFAGGADEVHVADGHGGTNPDPDLRTELLDPRATQVFRDVPFDPYVDLAEAGVYDAVAVVGMHAKTFSNGFLAHTVGLGTDLILNGRSVTETELIAFSFGRVGVPVVFASGDDVLRENLESMPWLRYAQVKESESAGRIKALLPLDEAHALLTELAKAAIEGLPEMKVMRLTAPIAAALRVREPASLAGLEGVPGIRYTADRVDFEAPDFLSAYHGLESLLSIASSAGRARAIADALADRGDGQEFGWAVFDRLAERTLAVEAGEWRPPAKPEAPRRRYHGF